MNGSSRFTAIVGTAAALSALTLAASAHHSMERFDTKQEVTINGVITRYEWANPHVYIFVEETKPSGEKVEWEIEGGPPAMMRRDGWSRETLQAGQQVSAVGNPGKNQYSNSIYLTTMKRADETLFSEDTFMGAMIAVDEAQTAKADGLDGVWTTLLKVDAVVQFYPDSLETNATEKGLAAIEAFDETTMHPGLNCIPFTAPTMMISPDVKRIQTSGEKILIGGEFDGVERTVHMDVDSHEGVGRSIQGHSIGRWEDGVLVIETAKFADHGVGIGFGVPSGAQKTLIERISLNEDRTGLTYAFELSDPEYIKEPMSGEIAWAYTPNTTFAPLPCNLENARRFIDN